MRAVLSKLTPAGSWQASVTLQSGETTVQAHATVQLGAMKATAFIPSGREILGGMIAILALGTAFWAMRLRRARRLQPAQPAESE
jgi:hypothetical protein